DLLPASPLTVSPCHLVIPNRPISRRDCNRSPKNRVARRGAIVACTGGGTQLSRRYAMSVLRSRRRGQENAALADPVVGPVPSMVGRPVARIGERPVPRI